MNIVIMSGAAYLLPRSCSYLCNYLCDNQNWGQGDRFAPLVSCIARRMINGCIAMKRYIMNARVVNSRMDTPQSTLFIFLTSAYDSAWIAMLLSARTFPTCCIGECVLLGTALFLSMLCVISVYINILRKYVELILMECQITPPNFLRTSFLLSKHRVLGTLSHSVRLLFWAFATLSLLSICILLLYTTIEFMFLMLIGAAIYWSEEISEVFALLSQKMRTPRNNAYLFDQITPHPGETLPDCPINRTTPDIPVRLRQCGHIFDREAILYWITHNNHPTCPQCRCPLVEVI